MLPVRAVRQGRTAGKSQAGYDIPMTKAVVRNVSLPVIASGGAGRLERLGEPILDAKADVVLAASIAQLGTFTIRRMKQHLADCGIPVST